MAGILNNSEMRAVSRNVRAVYYDALKTSPVVPFLASLFFIIQSSSLVEKFVMMRGEPTMRHWTGDRQLTGFSSAGFQIEKKDWEATITVTRDDLQYDRLGLVKPQIQSLARAYPKHFRKYVQDLFFNGDSTVCYDGQYFFDTDHDNYDGLFSNKSTATLSKTSFEAAMNAPLTLKDPVSGELLEVAYDTIYFSPANRAMVDSLLNDPEYIDNTTVPGSPLVRKNPNYHRIKPENQHEIREWGTSPKWFLTDESKSIKPLMLQIVQGPSMESYDDPHDWNMFSRKQPVYGVESQDNAGYMFWELAYGSTGTV